MRIASFPIKTHIRAFAFILAGFLFLFVPVYAAFSANAWTREENAHAYFILAIIIGTAFMRLARLHQTGWFSHQKAASIQESILGAALTLLGLILFLIGRYAQVELFLSIAPFFVLTGSLCFTFGWRLVRQLWFPLAMFFYLIIWPGWLLDQFTAPLKLWISENVTLLMTALGLPVAHSGVIIAAGPYQLLVADACAGLNSLIAMTAVGAIYLYIIKRPGLAVNALLFLALIPIAILANFIRVALLVWITLQFGYDAGQGFLHEAAGLMMFAIALVCLFALDSAVTFKKGHQQAQGEVLA